MFAIAGGQSVVGNPLIWSLFFARQPEPDLEFTEEELEETTSYRSSPPPRPPKRSNRQRPLLWVLLLVLIGGGAYVAMEPQMFMEYLEPLLGESPAPQPPPPVAKKPVVPKPPTAPIAPPPATTSAAPASVAPPVELPKATVPAPAPVPTPPSTPSTPTASAPSPIPEPASAAPAMNTAPSMIGSPTPLFSEGQRVTVLPNQASPGNAVPLMQDAEGTKPGLAVPPGTVLTVLDGDLQGGGWVYLVRSAFGDKGWVIEKQLKLKP